LAAYSVRIAIRKKEKEKEKEKEIPGSPNEVGRWELSRAESEF
jgi:hypothetical protein